MSRFLRTFAPAAALFAGVFALLALTPSLARAQSRPQSAAQSQGPGLGAETYVALATASDKFEISEAHLAQARGHNPRVQQFARMMARDHAKSTAMIRAAVRASVDHDPRPPVLSATQARMLAALRVTPPRRFDEVYIAQQVQAHGQALALHRAYAATGTDPELRQTAQLLAPVVQQHLDLARDLQQRMLLRR